jgi:hypothetical protein
VGVAGSADPGGHDSALQIKAVGLLAMACAGLIVGAAASLGLVSATRPLTSRSRALQPGPDRRAYLATWQAAACAGRSGRKTGVSTEHLSIA